MKTQPEQTGTVRNFRYYELQNCRSTGGKWHREMQSDNFATDGSEDAEALIVFRKKIAKVHADNSASDAALRAFIEIPDFAGYSRRIVLVQKTCTTVMS